MLILIVGEKDHKIGVACNGITFISHFMQIHLFVQMVDGRGENRHTDIVIS
jgi:hypothetical protein